jgi:hypothetical protein
MICPGTAIKAHAIQNSRALEAVAENGRVVMVKPEIKGVGFDVPFKLVGRNVATTFTGLCSEHDTLLFRPIDTNPIDATNPEHRFLVAYRAVLKGMHSALAVGQMVQMAFQKGVELGQFPEDGPEMMMATSHIIGAIQLYEFVECFHDVYRAGNWGRLQSSTLTIPAPALAASGVVLPIEAAVTNPKRADRPYLVFSMFPQQGSLYVQFSWLPEADAVMRSAISGIVSATGERQLYLLSKFILKYTETFTLKPSVYESFTERQKEEITRYFLANAAGARNEWDDASLYLFGTVS